MRKMEINSRVDFLTKNQYSEIDFYKIYNRIKIVEDDTENIDELRKLEKEFEKTALFLETLPEFDYALNALNLPGDTIKDVVEHENAHANKAEELKANEVKYGIGFMRKANGEKAILPFVYHKISGEKEGWSEERQKDANQKITQAPEEYGNKLSPSDIKKLKNE